VSVPVERFDLRCIPAQPWKNGAGLTREIAAGPRGAGNADFDWRFSVAEVERVAPFSVFPGIDRCIVLLAGAGLHLRSDDGSLDHRLDAPCEPFHFSGDLLLSAEPIDGPSSDFNVMTRRGGLRSIVRTHRAAAHLQGDGVALLLCVAGEWRTDEPELPTLGPLQGLLWRAGPVAIHVEPQHTAPGASLLFVRLCHDPTP
jgi:environmental stress-induced protein Ves